ncbi:histone H2A-Bbd type 1-like [Ursus americanus]|uniref:histone H2A-Bbd type 1-like n=1 Tax=Ursus americanus TaxID=9643 RepID=UPI001E679A17|nr:histone H2A-Bbd type 1-like [Ursus americanus]XP_045646416.1 histone H2A-Bbd type 1-like [Ursus americanus]
MSGRRSHWHSHRHKRHGLSRSMRAELQFPVSRVDRLLREGLYAQRLSSSTPIFLAGILEYLTANILELAGQEARNHHKMRITPEHVQRALVNNQHLSRLFGDNTSPPAEGAPQPGKC